MIPEKDQKDRKKNTCVSVVYVWAAFVCSLFHAINALSHGCSLNVLVWYNKNCVRSTRTVQEVLRAKETTDSLQEKEEMWFMLSLSRNRSSVSFVSSCLLFYSLLFCTVLYCSVLFFHSLLLTDLTVFSSFLGLTLSAGDLSAFHSCPTRKRRMCCSVILICLSSSFLFCYHIFILCLGQQTDQQSLLKKNSMNQFITQPMPLLVYLSFFRLSWNDERAVKQSTLLKSLPTSRIWSSLSLMVFCWLWVPKRQVNTRTRTRTRPWLSFCETQV